MTSIVQDAAVLAPIRLHVEAKRYLCAVDPAYHARLSDDSRRSLRLEIARREGEAAGEYRDRQVCLGEGGAEVRGHVVGTLERMPVVGRILRHSSVEKALEVAPHLGRSVFVQGQTCRRVVNE